MVLESIASYYGLVEYIIWKLPVDLWNLWRAVHLSLWHPLAGLREIDDQKRQFLLASLPFHSFRCPVLDPIRRCCWIYSLILHMIWYMSWDLLQITWEHNFYNQNPNDYHSNAQQESSDVSLFLESIKSHSLSSSSFQTDPGAKGICIVQDAISIRRER